MKAKLKEKSPIFKDPPSIDNLVFIEARKEENQYKIDKVIYKILNVTTVMVRIVVNMIYFRCQKLLQCKWCKILVRDEGGQVYIIFQLVFSYKMSHPVLYSWNTSCHQNFNCSPKLIMSEFGNICQKWLFKEGFCAKTRFSSLLQDVWSFGDNPILLS